MTRRYGNFPTTADVGIWASGTNVAEVYEALGLGLFALMTDLRKVRPRFERVVEASARDPEGLAVAFLEQLILLADADGFRARSIHARPVGSPPTALLATVRGEPFDAERHPRRKDVKAVTLHDAQVDLERHRARVIVDI